MRRKSVHHQFEVSRSIGDVQVHLHSEVKRYADALANLYPCNGGSTSGPTVNMRISKCRSRWGTSRYRVHGDGEQVGGDLRRREVFPFLEWGINLRVIARYARFVQLHAATLAHRGQGFVFAGASGSGKSTLAAALLAHGWDYYCDEFALIDRDTRRLHAFPKALCIKSGSIRALRPLGLPLARACDHIKVHKGRVAYVNPHDIRPDCIAEPMPVRFVIFPRYIEDAEPRLQPVSRARALIDLAACVFNRHVYPHYALDVLAPLIQNAKCYRLDVGTPTDTCKLLETLTSARETSVSAATINKTAQPKRPQTGVARVAHPSRRDLLRRGAKLAYVAPVVLTLSAQDAFGAPSIPSGSCSSGVQTGGLCNTDADCCSGKCDLGVCQ